MKSRPLGSTGATVSEIGLGAMPLALANRPSVEESIRVIHAALDSGMTWIDVADAYCLDESEKGYCERLVARAVREWSGPRDAIRIATKGGWLRPSGHWKFDGRPEHLRAACEASLKALGVPSVFLYQLHNTDSHVPLRESIGALVDLKRQGKVEHIGLSNVDAAQLRQALSITEVASVQNAFNPLNRECMWNGVLEACERHAVSFIAHSPVGGHFGTGRSVVANHPILKIVASRHGATPQQAAIAWALAVCPAILPIPGSSRAETARASAAAADIELTRQDRADLDAAFPRLASGRARIMTVRREAQHLARRVGARVSYGLRRWLT
jgi:aryl-alcohol dehydrogenase-like predicted oxidoreductase